MAERQKGRDRMGKFTRPTVIPADQYEGRHDRIETRENKETGDEFNIWTFLAQYNGTDVELTATSSTNTGPKSKAGKWAAALLGRAPTDEEIDDDLQVLEGLPCRLIVEIDPDTHYNVIEAVLPPRMKAKSPKQEPAPAPTATPVTDTPDELPF
jgi:hypothetical protein